MPLELVTLPALSDNYTYLVHDSKSGATACVDVPEAQPIVDAVTQRGWTLTDIWLTHHHHDHIGGVDDLLRVFDAKVTGATADRHRLPTLNKEVGEGDRFEFGGEVITVLDVSGHTVGHIAFVASESGLGERRIDTRGQAGRSRTGAAAQGRLCLCGQRR